MGEHLLSVTDMLLIGAVPSFFSTYVYFTGNGATPKVRFAVFVSVVCGIRIVIVAVAVSVGPARPFGKVPVAVDVFVVFAFMIPIHVNMADLPGARIATLAGVTGEHLSSETDTLLRVAAPVLFSV